MKLDDVKKLHQKKYRLQFGYYLVEGEHLVLELHKAIASDGHTPDLQARDIALYVTDEYQDWATQLQPVFTTHLVSKKQMQQLSDTKSPQGIIARVPIPKAPEQLGLSQAGLSNKDTRQNNQKTESCIYLHEVQDPGNLGTILRTLAWFGNFRLLLSPNSVDPFNSKVVRASMGAIFHVPVELDVSLDQLKTRFQKFAYLDMQGNPVNSSTFNDYPCYLFGNEARGVPRAALSEFNATAFTIPGNGNIDSLNLASAVNICAYQMAVMPG